MLAHTLMPRDCKCQWLVTQTHVQGLRQSHMGGEMEPAKREDWMTGQTLVSCLTHSVSQLSISEHVWGIFKFPLSAWLSPFNASLLGVDWLSSLNNCLRSSSWLSAFELLFPNFSGVKMKWKRNDVLDSGMRVNIFRRSRRKMKG